MERKEARKLYDTRGGTYVLQDEGTALYNMHELGVILGTFSHWYGYEHHFTCAATSSLRPVCLRRSEANLGTADGHRKDRDSDDNAAVRTPS